MRKYDRSIKVLQDEIFRVTGKVAFDEVEKGHNPAWATKCAHVRHLREAISLLKNHDTNKHV